MGVLKFFRKKSKSEKIQQTPVDVVKEALSKYKIDCAKEEIAEIINQLWSSIDFIYVWPETLVESDSAEMEFKDNRFIVYVSMLLGQISQETLNVLKTCAVYWASASVLAKRKGFKNLTLQEGQRIAICDGTEANVVYTHPIYQLFPKLLNIILPKIEADKYYL